MSAPGRGFFSLWPLALACLLASCVQAPPLPDAPAPAPAPASPPPPPEEPMTPSAFELYRRDRALTFQKQGRWADAAAEWEVLALLRPDRPDYRKELNDATAQIEKAVSERLQSASDARVRGDIERAQMLYFKVLSLDPDNSVAAQALRELETERSRRARASRPAAVAKVEKPASARGASEAERRELEYGSLLLRQGEYAASIKSFENYVKTYPKDDLGRRYLADAYFQLGQQRLQQGKKEEALAHLDRAYRLRGNDAPEINGTLTAVRKSLAEDYYQQGLRSQTTDIRQAIGYWERAVRIDPSHFNATARLQQARQMDKNLRAIEGSGQRP